MAEKEIKRVITIESSESLNTLNNLSTRIKELKGSMGDLDIASEEYRQTSEEVTKLENMKRNAIRGVTAAVEGSYNAYSKELSILQKHRKTLNENSDEYKEMTKRVAELQEKLKGMDAEVGVFSRNVGNYASAFDGLQGSVNGVVAQLPNLNGGIVSFSNSLKEALPRLIESVENYKAMAKEAGQSVSAVAALGKAFLSWNAVISIAVTLIGAFGDKITEWVKGLFDAEKRLSATEKVTRELNKRIEESGLGIGDTIVKIKQMQVAWGNLGNDMSAKQKYIEDSRKAFEDLGIEINNVADAEAFLINQTESYIESMKQRAMATAAFKLASEYYDKVASLMVANATDQAKFDAMPDMLSGTFVSISGSGSAAGVTHSQVNTEKTRLGETMANREKEIASLNELADAAFKLGASIKVTTPQRSGGGGSTSSSKSRYSAPGALMSFGGGMAGGGTLGMIGDAVDATAEYEKLKATLEARQKMLTADANERVQIEQRLADEIAMIEEIRLGSHEIILMEQLRSEDLTAEERLAIEEELTKNKIAQADLQIKNEERRAKEEKAIKDKADKEDRARKEKYQQFSVAMAQATSNILKNVADMYEEDSRERKALNAASIVMDTFTAAMSGWKSGMALPMPLGPIVAGANVAASVAMGAMQLKNLLATAEDGSNASSALSSATSAPSVANSMPASYTRNLQGDNELTELNKETRVYVVESDITEAQKSAKVRVQSASF